MLKNIKTIFFKEMRLYVVTPIASVMGSMFLLLQGFIFASYARDISRKSIEMMNNFRQGGTPFIDLHLLLFTPTLIWTLFILLLIIPILTMRLLSEEKKQKTDELLLTSPITIGEILIAKYLAALFIFSILLVLTLSMPLIISFYSDINLELLFTSYLGLFFVGAVFISFGLLASAITENQIIAAILSFGMLLFLWLFKTAAIAAGPVMGPLLAYLSVTLHLENFLKGLIDSKDVIYYLSASSLGLFLSYQVYESRKWK